MRVWVASRLRHWADGLDPAPKLPYRRLSLVTVVKPRKQERIRRRLGEYRDPRDVYDAAVRWGQKQCILRSVELLRSESRDYFDFDVYVDDRDNIIVRSTLKVRKDD
jgi:hypothetical protein